MSTPVVGVREEDPHAAQEQPRRLERIRCVLSGLPFPAAKWQVITHAEAYGADAATRGDLWSLPVGSYPDLPAVLVGLGLAKAFATRPGYRVAPTVQAAARDLPVRDHSGA